MKDGNHGFGIGHELWDIERFHGIGGGTSNIDPTDPGTDPYGPRPSIDDFPGV